MQIANNEITCNVNSQQCKKYVKRNLEIVLCIFQKLDIFAKFVGKILHPSRQSLSQIEYNETKLQ